MVRGAILHHVVCTLYMPPFISPFYTFIAMHLCTPRIYMYIQPYIHPNTPLYNPYTPHIHPFTYNPLHTSSTYVLYIRDRYRPCWSSWRYRGRRGQGRSTGYGKSWCYDRRRFYRFSCPR